MLQLAGGIALGVDVADFLQLQRTFHGQGEHRAAAQEQDVARLGQVQGQGVDAGVHLQRLGDQAGRLEQGLDQFGLLGGVDAAARHARRDGQRQQGGDLGGEGLGRGDSDLGARMGRPQDLGLARHGRGVDVDHGGRPQPLRLAPGQAGQGVGGLARLADGDGQRPLGHGRAAVAELRGDFHVAGQARILLEGVFADLAGVEGGAAGDDLDALDRGEVHGLDLGLARDQVEVFRQGVLDAVGLLMDLLLHEVAVLALLDQGRGGRDLDHGAVGRAAVGVEHARAGAGHGHVVAFLEVGDLLGEGADGQGVRAQIHLALAPADDQGAAAARAQDQLVLALDQHGERIGAGQPVQRGLEGVQRGQARRQLVVQQMGHDLGVGLAFKDAALGLHLGLQFGEILDDAVVDQADAPGLVRVGVGLGGGAVGGPAGVADADGPGHRVGGEHRLQLADLALGAAALDAPAVLHGDAGGVIAPILQPLQAVDQARDDGAGSGDADDAAHEVCSDKVRVASAFARGREYGVSEEVRPPPCDPRI
ncbi:hypothetical protein D3C77_277200 [compost metagenome]